MTSDPTSMRRFASLSRRTGTWFLVLLAGVVAFVLANFCFLEVRHATLRALSVLDDASAKVSTASWSSSESSALPAGTRVFFHRARTTSAVAENSAAALDTAEAKRVSIEFDVAFTSDGFAYVSHGDDLGESTMSDHTEQEYLSLVSKGRLAPRTKLSGRVRHLLAQPPSNYVFDLKPGRHQEAVAAEVVLRDIPEPYLRGSTFLSPSGRALLLLKESGRVNNLGCESFSPLGNRLAGMNWYSHNLETLTPWGDALARRLGLKRIYWVVKTPADWGLVRASAPDVVLIAPTAGPIP